MENVSSPKVSIITSIFKSERFIKHFLDDVARQTVFSDCEILLLNAQSPENEEQYILNFQKVFPKNVKYYKLDKRYSVYETWNKAIALSNSPILANWNTDDRRVFNSLEAQLLEFEKDPDLDVCYGPTITTFNENESVENCLSREGFGCFDLKDVPLIRNNSPHCFPMWKKSLHSRFGDFNTNYFSAADYEMWLRVFANGAKFKKIDSLIGSYYRNPEGISSNPQTYSRAIDEVKSIIEDYRTP